MIRFLIAFLMLVSISGCKNYCSYTTEKVETGIYVDDQNREYNIVVDHSISDYNFGEDALSADEVAELAYLLVDEHKKMGLPNNQKVYDFLSHGHFVIAANKKSFEMMYDGDNLHNLEAYVYVFDYTTDPCWETYPSEARWTSAIRPEFWDRKNPGVIIHEMLHAISAATYGHIDHDHLNPLLWEDFDGSLYQRVIKQY